MVWQALSLPSCLPACLPFCLQPFFPRALHMRGMATNSADLLRAGVLEASAFVVAPSFPCRLVPDRCDDAAVVTTARITHLLQQQQLQAQAQWQGGTSPNRLSNRHFRITPRARSRSIVTPNTFRNTKRSSMHSRGSIRPASSAVWHERLSITSVDMRRGSISARNGSAKNRHGKATCLPPPLKNLNIVTEIMDLSSLQVCAD